MTAVLRRRDGDTIDLDVDRWHRDAGPDELTLLARLPGPVLDVGCGPGRAVAALVRAGRLALGIDREPRAVAAARARGAAALERCVFDSLPGEGRWGSVLLLDGCIGIGGDPPRLLRRVRELLAPDGVVLAEVTAPHATSEIVTVRVEHSTRATPGPWFRWATLSTADVATAASEGGLRCDEVERIGERWFAWLQHP
jgi:SAM-dependent methyltransferase